MTKFRIEYAAGVLRDLKGLPREVRVRALEAVEQVLAADPFLGRPLAGSFKGLFKFRIGDYRIIYAVERHRLVIFVLRIRHRKDVYRGLL